MTDLFVGLVGFVFTLVALVAISSAVQAALVSRRVLTTLGRTRDRHEHNVEMLALLVLIAALYDGLVLLLPGLTGTAMLDGSVGVALGLFICAQPAANAVNTLFFERDLLSRLSEWSVVLWLLLNMLVLLLGWTVIFVGLRLLF